MKYLQAVLNETLRLYPAIPFNMRIALENTCLPHGGGVDGLDPICVQKNTIIAYTPLIMQRRPDIYPAAYGDGTPFPSPEVFEPERWVHDSTAIPAYPLQDGNIAEIPGGSEASSKATWNPPAWTYLPFNGGPRICLGQQFALTEMAYTLVRIFQRYERIERVHAAGEYGSLKANIVLTPSHGVKVRFVESSKGT
jgi:cytochrome P450